jgi:hypothetical protein
MSQVATPPQPPRVAAFPDARSPAKLKLLDQVRHLIRARHYSHRIEEAYVHWIRRYIVFPLARLPVPVGFDTS